AARHEMAQREGRRATVIERQRAIPARGLHAAGGGQPEQRNGDPYHVQPNITQAWSAASPRAREAVAQRPYGVVAWRRARRHRGLFRWMSSMPVATMG